MASHFLGTGTGQGDGAVSCVVPVQSRLASSNLRYRHNFWAPSIAVAALPRRLESAQLPRATSGPTPGSRPAPDAVPPPAVLRPAVPGYRKHSGGIRGGAPPDRHTLDLSSLPGGSPPAPSPPWRHAEGVRGAAPHDLRRPLPGWRGLPPQDLPAAEQGREHARAAIPAARGGDTPGSGAPDDVEELHGVQMDPRSGRRWHITTDIPDEPLGRCLIVEDHVVVRADAVG